MAQNDETSSLVGNGPELIPASTHAERHPDIVQPGRQREHISKQRAAARAIQSQIARQKREVLISDLDKAMSDHSKALEDLARKHAVTNDYIQKLVTSAPAFKKKRAPNIHNAMLHMKAMETNDDLSTGNRKKLPELQKLVAMDEELQNMSKEERREIIDELEAFRKLKQAGARPSNRSAATDYRAVVDNLMVEFQHLSDRTGACAVAFLSRGHLDDTFEPAYICSPNAGNFVSETLKMGPSDVARLLEQWACSIARRKTPVDTLASMRIEVAALILEGLKAAAQTSKISMSYVNYDRQIVQTYCVKLIGWTCKEFVSPQEISTVDDIRTLRDALQVGSCKWIRLSKHEVNRHMKDYEKRLENGEVSKKKRKERSDKGKKRKRTEPDAETISSNSETEERPSKKTDKRKGKENSVEVRPNKEPRGRQTMKSSRTGSDKAARRKLKMQLPPRSKSIISDSGSDPEGDLPDLSTPPNVERNSNSTNAGAQRRRTSASPLRSNFTPAPTGTSAYQETNSSACPETAAPRPLALSSILNNDQSQGTIASNTDHPRSFLFSSLQGVESTAYGGYLPTETTFSKDQSGLGAGLAHSRHNMAPAHASFDPTGFSTSYNGPGPFFASTGLFPPQAPLIPTGSPYRQAPTWQMSPVHGSGLSLPPDMLPRRFSTPEILTPPFQISLPCSSGLSLPPDMQNPSFVTSNTHNIWPYNHS